MLDLYSANISRLPADEKILHRKKSGKEDKGKIERLLSREDAFTFACAPFGFRQRNFNKEGKNIRFSINPTQDAAMTMQFYPPSVLVLIP